MGLGTSLKGGFGAPPNPNPPLPSYEDPNQSFPSSSSQFEKQPPRGSNTHPPNFACIILSRRDRVRLCGFPPTLIPIVNEAITRVWVPGIQKQEHNQSTYEWKLSGNPWSGQGSEAVPARRLIIHILHALAAAGWELLASCDLSKKGWDKDTLFFKSAAPRQRYFFSISFNESDKIRLIDSPNVETLQAFIAATRTWIPGIQDSREKEANCFQVKLKGRPWWSSSGDEIAHSRLLVCAILQAMDARGFELVGSIDMSVGQGEDNSDLDTWFFASK